VAPFLQMGPSWTHETPLPGGDFPYDGVDALVQRVRGLQPFLTEAHALRLVRAYGTRLERIVAGASSLAGLGTCFGDDLTAAEVRYLMQHEWAETAEDILWRRSKLGLHLSPEQQDALARFMAAEGGTTQPADAAAE
jgi:glycerol-3-phosphate dehydrogenase